MRAVGVHDNNQMDPNFETFNSGSTYLSDLLEISNFTKYKAASLENR